MVAGCLDTDLESLLEGDLDYKLEIDLLCTVASPELNMD